MRNRNVAGYRAQWGGSAASLRALETRVRKATERVNSQTAAQLNDINEKVNAAEDVAKAQEELESAKAAQAHLEKRSKQW